MNANDLKFLVVWIVKFADVHPQWVGTYKVLRNDLLNVEFGAWGERAERLPKGTKGFTTYLKWLCPMLLEKGVELRVDGTIRQRLRFQLTKVGGSDVVPTIAST